MMLRRTLEGALKCALRDLRREEWMAGRALLIIFSARFGYIVASASCLQELTIVTDFEGRRGIVKVS